MFPHFHASRTRRTVWKDLEIMEANENKPKVSGFYCIDQLNLLRYCGIKVNGSKEKPSRFLQVQKIIDQCMADIRNWSRQSSQPGQPGWCDEAGEEALIKAII